MRRQKRATPPRKTSRSPQAHRLEISAVKKDIRKAVPSRLGRPGREWLKACLDCLRNLTRPDVMRYTRTEWAVVQLRKAA
jgi:hypothetical protein